MTPDITTAKSDKHDEYEFDDLVDLTDGFIAATTNRRVGRCMRKAPGPSADDGAGQGANSTDECPENLANALLETVQATLKSHKGFDDLGQALCDQPIGALAPEDLEKLTRTFQQLRDEAIFETPIYAVPPGDNQRVLFPSGKSVSVELTSCQHALGQRDGDVLVIAVAANLPPAMQCYAALRILAEEVEAIAAENGLYAAPGAVLDWLEDVTETPIN